MEHRLNLKNRKVQRRFNKEWQESGIINTKKIPALVQSLVAQQDEMVEYIEFLQDKIDFILETNNCCTIESCLRANCTSDHK